MTIEQRREAMRGRYGDSAYRFGKTCRELVSAGDISSTSHYKSVLPPRSPEERLDYYRTHGLVDCDDYSGGDGQFEADVLSNAYHDDVPTIGSLRREDKYVIKHMESGKFKFSPDFRDHELIPELYLAFLMNCRKNGFTVRFNYPGGFSQYAEDVRSKLVSRTILEKRGLL